MGTAPKQITATPFYVPLLVATFLGPIAAFGLAVWNSHNLRCAKIWSHVLLAAATLTIIFCLHITVAPEGPVRLGAWTGLDEEAAAKLIRIGLVAVALLGLIAITTRQFDAYRFHAGEGFKPKFRIRKSLAAVLLYFILSVVYAPSGATPAGQAGQFLFMSVRL